MGMMQTARVIYLFSTLTGGMTGARPRGECGRALPRIAPLQQIQSRESESDGATPCIENRLLPSDSGRTGSST
jgi:hypothetical protein